MHRCFSIFFLLLPLFTFGQHQPVFPNLEGQELLDNLVIEFKPEITLGYGPARDILYGEIDSPNDSITCVYTGFTIYLDPSADPTEAMFMNDGPDAMNTEHTYPQSLGASGVLRADMHNIYPTRKDVNGARGNDPFAEIPDNQTEVWWIQDQSQGSIPSQNIDDYSEETFGFFEPREDHKGDVARSMFYFYTMYKAEADAQNSSYFNDQVQTFCQWHFDDPVDTKEWNRTHGIAPYQSGKANPFVLDCTLPQRSYCMNLNLECIPVSTNEPQKSTAQLYANSPNPFQEQTKISFLLDRTYTVTLKAVDQMGQSKVIIDNEQKTAGIYQLDYATNAQLAKGIHVLQLMLEDGQNTYYFHQKMLVL